MNIAVFPSYDKQANDDETTDGLLNTQEELFNVDIFPNPSSGKFNIKGSGIAAIEVYDVLGRKIMNLPFTSIIDLSSQEAGMYYLSLLDENGRKLKETKVLIIK